MNEGERERVGESKKLSLNGRREGEGVGER